MMFQTIGLNTGSVRLETVIFGFCCATAAVAETSASAHVTVKAAAASVARPRRGIVSIKSTPLNCQRNFGHRSLGALRRTAIPSALSLGRGVQRAFAPARIAAHRPAASGLGGSPLRHHAIVRNAPSQEVSLGPG